MGYEKFVEIGRVAFVSAGPSKGKLAVIVDVLDQNRALVDGPCSGVARHVANFKALQLTKYVVKVGPGARTGTVTKAWTKADITSKFKLMKAKQARRGMQSQLYGKANKILKSKK
ncbi:RPL14 [Bugula neritina]|uniref:Large ribosomal subunit protein eL14 n=1 Tax=Bugula neritina TaxID=10212 RepID=A0A7J7JR16_BUGNE|nr:RPL14 [Bugula neritina]